MNTAKSECENLQLHKVPRSRTSSATERGRSRTSTAEQGNSFFTDRDRSTENISSKTRDGETNKHSSFEQRNFYETATAEVRSHRSQMKNKVSSSYRHNNGEPHSGLERKLEPLAISTPRKSKSANNATHQLSTQTTMLPAASIEHSKHVPLVSSQSTSLAAIQPIPAGHKPTQSSRDNATSFRYDRLRDIQPEKSATQTSQQPLADNARSLNSNGSSNGKSTKTKEVVEIKHRNSAELDPSKSFKPINPDNGVPKATSTSRYQPMSSYKPSSYTSGVNPTYSTNKSYPTASSTSSQYNKPYSYPSTSVQYDRPYKSKYEPSVYKSKYAPLDSKLGDDCRNTSADSAYSSPSRSYSKLPSVSSYTSSYRKNYTLPSITPTSARYSTSVPKAAEDNSLSKVPSLIAAQRLITA